MPLETLADAVANVHVLVAQQGPRFVRESVGRGERRGERSVLVAQQGPRFVRKSVGRGERRGLI